MFIPPIPHENSKLLNLWEHVIYEEDNTAPSQNHF